MKKVLSFVLMTLVVMIPLGTAHAASEITFSCVTNSDDSRTCQIDYTIDSSSPQSSVTVNLTEQGGADITDVSAISGGDFSITSQNESDGVWTIVLESPDEVVGTYSLFTFTYVASGEDDCKVVISIGDSNKTITTTSTDDTPADNAQTGSTLPYVAFGAIVLVAAVAYVSLRNKSKMYRL